MLRLKNILLVFALLWAGAPGAELTAAPAIVLQPEPGCRLANGQVEAHLRLTNRGSAAAKAVQVEAMLHNRSGHSQIVPALAPGETERFTLALGPAPTPPGRHGVLFHIVYADAKGQRADLWSHIPLVTTAHRREPAPITMRLSATDGKQGGALHATLVHQGDQPTEAALKLRAPRVLAIAPSQKTVRLEPGQEKTLLFAWENRSARPHSRHAVLASMDYTVDGRHWNRAATTVVHVRAPDRAWMLRGAATLLAAWLLALWGIAQFRRRPSCTRRSTHGRSPFLFHAVLLAAAMVFTALQLQPQLWLADTLTTGGDIPAHNYLASHLRESLFGSGRIVSWAQGWWAGFPMFQYYFPLPYLLIVVLDKVVPFNIAFKLVSVAGILALPLCAWRFARSIRLPDPAAVLLGLFMVPFLFTRAHFMWGVNVYSTLAGMIANSIGFSLMLLFMGCAWRDAEQGRFRLRTVLLLCALIASHFFTTLMAVIVLAALPWLGPASGGRQSFKTLLGTGLLGFGLMAWWLVPLAAKIEYSVDFGGDWDVALHASLPAFALVLIPGLLVALGAGLRRRLGAIALLGWMLAAAILLFEHGSRLATVFDNIRLWPFILFAWTALGAAGLGLFLARRPRPEPALAALAILALAWGIEPPNQAPDFARWNYEGAEAKPGWTALERLVLPLDGTPGRLANDLHPGNERLGSTRIFESVPHLIDKPILEGGIVNSAAGSLFAYYIQSTTSRASAGSPRMVEPAQFQFENATRYLELFNVKHFIARWSRTQSALANSDAWRKLGAHGDWELYEATGHDGAYVRTPAHDPMGLALPRDRAGRAWKKAGLEWMQTVRALDQPFVLLAPGDPAPPVERIVSLSEFRTHLADLASGDARALPFRPLEHAARISGETIESDRIRFTTDAPGQPHIVAISHFPNWKVKGAEHVYRVTPGFMLVYPDQPEVEMYYGTVFSDRLGRILSAATLFLLGVILWQRRKERSIL